MMGNDFITYSSSFIGQVLSIVNLWVKCLFKGLGKFENG
jgi:hypothetical protein